MRFQAFELTVKEMLLDLGVTSQISTEAFAIVLRLAEKGNYHRLWIGEDIDKPHDVFVQASQALLESHLNVGVGITSIYMRNISNIARAAASLAETGNSRFTLGIGIGGIQNLTEMGITPKKPVQTMREATLLLRRIWKGETITFDSVSFHLKSYFARFGLGQRIPIYFGVRGPRLLELAGEVADGVIISGPKSYVKEAVETVRNGIRKSGRREKDVNLVVWIPTILTQQTKDLELARRVVAFVLADTPRSVLHMSRIKVETAQEVQKTRAQEGIDAATALVTDEMLDDMIFHGSARELCESFLSLEDYGVGEVAFGPPFGVDWQSAIDQVAKAWRKAS